MTDAILETDIEVSVPTKQKKERKPKAPKEVNQTRSQAMKESYSKRKKLKSITTMMYTLLLVGMGSVVVNQFIAWDFWVGDAKDAYTIITQGGTQIVLEIACLALVFITGWKQKAIGFAGMLLMTIVPCYEVSQPYWDARIGEEKQELAQTIEQDLNEGFVLAKASLATASKNVKVFQEQGKVFADVNAKQANADHSEATKTALSLLSQKVEMGKARLENGTTQTETIKEQYAMWLKVVYIGITMVATFMIMSYCGKLNRDRLDLLG